MTDLTAIDGQIAALAAERDRLTTRLRDLAGHRIAVTVRDTYPTAAYLLWEDQEPVGTPNLSVLDGDGNDLSPTADDYLAGNDEAIGAWEEIADTIHEALNHIDKSGLMDLSWEPGEQRGRHYPEGVEIDNYGYLSRAHLCIDTMLADVA